MNYRFAGKIDIDNFTSYNYTNSFESGDLVLCFIEEQFILSSLINKIMHISSDEFIFFSIEENCDSLRDEILKILKNITKYKSVTCSCCIMEIATNPLNEDNIFNLNLGVSTAKSINGNSILII